MLHLLVGIDTEGDNQWSAEARLNQAFEKLAHLVLDENSVLTPRTKARLNPPVSA